MSKTNRIVLIKLTLTLHESWNYFPVKLWSPCNKKQYKKPIEGRPNPFCPTWGLDRLKQASTHTTASLLPNTMSRTNTEKRRFWFDLHKEIFKLSHHFFWIYFILHMQKCCPPELLARSQQVIVKSIGIILNNKIC